MANSVVDSQDAFLQLIAANKRIKQLEEKLQQYQWQPIDTAPKDGSPLLLSGYDQECDRLVVSCGSWLSDEDYIGSDLNFSGEWILHFYDWTFEDPLYWMPLPKPPDSK